MRSFFCFAGALIASLTPVVAAHNDRRQDNATVSRPKVILDNDWPTTGFITYLLALNAGWEVLGLVSDTSDSWALTCGLHALATLEVGDLSCIPVYRGTDYPILRRAETFQVWEMLHGNLPWQGVFAVENSTREALGNNPTGGDPNRIVRGAFKEGYPNTTFASEISGAEFMVQQVRKYPGEISIYSAGALTNIALAVRIDPNFAKNAKELVIMGGYIDGNLLQTTGSKRLADFQSDINLMIDPEGAKMVLSADFPNITIVGNAANQVLITQDFLDELYQVKTPYTELLNAYSSLGQPFWDETAAAVMVEPSIVRNSTRFLVDVDTSFGSPSYGNIHAYQQILAPRAQQLQEVNYVLEIDGDVLKQRIKESVQYPAKVCSHKG